MDYGKAFGFVFEDKNWVTKVLIGGLLYLAGFLVIPLFFVEGYLIELTQRAMKGDMSLPEWDNWGDKLKKGFSVSVALFIYILPGILLILIPIILAIILGGASGDSDAAGGIVAVVMLLFYGLYFLYILFFYFLMPAIIVQYARTESISQTLRVGEIFAIVKNNFVQVLILVAFVFLAGFISQIGIIALLIGVFFTTFYSQLMLHNLFGQFGKLLEETK